MATLARIRPLLMPPWLPRWVPATYLSPFIVLCKTLGAIIYAIALVPLALFARPSRSIKVAAALLLFICAYPALRSQNLAPVESALSAAGSVSKDRASSLLVRVQNEDRLLAKANEKPFFGWGEWGRNRVYSAEWSIDISITDGGWIIYYGVFGWLGYLALFDLFTVPVLQLHRVVENSDEQDAIRVGGAALMLAANVADMIPNNNLTLVTLLIAGSIGRIAPFARTVSAPRPSAEVPSRAQPVLGRARDTEPGWTDASARPS